jgi:carboxypeptidase Q
MDRKLSHLLSGRFSLAFFGLTAALAAAQTSTADKSSSTNDVIAQIRDEGLNHSQVMETLTYLTEVIGPRLTGSPNMKRANEWTRDKLAGWGLANAHLEAWGPFGRGWSLKRFSAQVVEPQCFPLVGCPNAWSPGLDKPLVADVVYLDTRTNTNLESYKGKLRGVIVLTSPAREVKPHFDALATRLAETNLLELANAGEPPRSGGPLVRLGGGRAGGARAGAGPGAGSMTNRAGFRRAGMASRSRNLSFLAKEGAALVVNCSMGGDGGTLGVEGASVPLPEGQSAGSGSFTNLPRAWHTNAPAIPPQITLAAEDYNRLLRMIQQGEKVTMAVDLQVQFHNQDLMAYNTIAEIPGSDRKDEIVMLGAHLDSWHAGTGATDNGVGVAATMEAMRILKALKVQPRRTIRLGLWSAEEQGLLGSKAYVAAHFGYYTNSPEPTSVRSPKDQASSPAEVKKPASTNAPPARRLVRLKEYEKLSAYFNLDNGAGRIRGIYLQGNETARPLFRRWLEAFRNLDAHTISLSNTMGTDHMSFDAIGLPGFQFIQDPLDYMSRTHHTNQDVLDRVQPEDAKQTAVILAAFAWDAAMADSKLPRKPLTP